MIIDVIDCLFVMLAVVIYIYETCYAIKNV